MARKRNVPVVDLSSSDCSDGHEDDELSLPLDSSDPDQNDDSNYDDLVDSDVSIFFLSCLFVSFVLVP
jgi:hypothetical protein